ATARAAFLVAPDSFGHAAQPATDGVTARGGPCRHPRKFPRCPRLRGAGPVHAAASRRTDRLDAIEVAGGSLRCCVAEIYWGAGGSLKARYERGPPPARKVKWQFTARLRESPECSRRRALWACITFCILWEMVSMTARYLSPTLCLAAAFMLAGAAHADDGRRQARDRAAPPRAAEQSGRPAPGRRPDSLADSVRRVRARTGGQVLSAEPVSFDGRSLNRVKVVDDGGRVRVYMDDPSARPRRPPRPAPTRGDDD